MILDKLYIDSIGDLVIKDHDLLDGLTDDDHTIYALLAGRSGGQTLYGDTASGGDLTFSSTAHGTKGSIFFGMGAFKMEFKEDDNKLLIGNITLNSEDSRADIGDPGTEGAGINIGGVNVKTGIRMNDFGADNPAQIIAHRHSTTRDPEFIGARSNTDDATHDSVVEDMCTLKLTGVGWTVGHYDRFGEIRICPDAGTINATSSPGKISFWPTPDGSNTPAEAMRIRSTQTLHYQDFVLTAGKKLIFDGA